MRSFTLSNISNVSLLGLRIASVANVGLDVALLARGVAEARLCKSAPLESAMNNKDLGILSEPESTIRLAV